MKTVSSSIQKLAKVISAKTWENQEILDKRFGQNLELGKAFPKEENLESFKTMVLEYIKEVKSQLINAQ